MQKDRGFSTAENRFENKQRNRNEIPKNRRQTGNEKSQTNFSPNPVAPPPPPAQNFGKAPAWNQAGASLMQGLAAAPVAKASGYGMAPVPGGPGYGAYPGAPIFDPRVPPPKFAPPQPPMQFGAFNRPQAQPPRGFQPPPPQQKGASAMPMAPIRVKNIVPPHTSPLPPLLHTALTHWHSQAGVDLWVLG